MTTITLTPDLEDVLTLEAQRQGTSPELLVLDGLRRQYLPASNVVEGETAYDFLKDFIGVIHSGEYVPGGARLSEECGGKFTKSYSSRREADKDGGH